MKPSSKHIAAAFIALGLVPAAAVTVLPHSGPVLKDALETTIQTIYNSIGIAKAYGAAIDYITVVKQAQDIVGNYVPTLGDRNTVMAPECDTFGPSNGLGDLFNGTVAVATGSTNVDSENTIINIARTCLYRTKLDMQANNTGSDEEIRNVEELLKKLGGPSNLDTITLLPIITDKGEYYQPAF